MSWEKKWKKEKKPAKDGPSHQKVKKPRLSDAWAKGQQRAVSQTPGQKKRR